MKFQVVETVQAMRDAARQCRINAGPLGLVPTMGALHEGHGALVRQSAGECGTTVVSVFVNPTQFNDPEDLRLYPRNLESDLELCERWGADIVFVPSVEEMYPDEPLTGVEVRGITEHLCGAFRPGHFRGVATVVAKLFNIVQPDRAYFGQKDAQQLAVIRQMVRDLNFPVEVRSVPTVREADGLAMSSRNSRLSPQHRSLAPRLFQALRAVADLAAAGERDAAQLRQRGIALLDHENIKVEYFEVVHADTLQPAGRLDRDVLIAAAIWLGGVRLIDNILLSGSS